eukprot:762931-Hanusia_phi.AAC.2
MAVSMESRSDARLASYDESEPPVHDIRAHCADKERGAGRGGVSDQGSPTLPTDAAFTARHALEATCRPRGGDEEWGMAAALPPFRNRSSRQGRACVSEHDRQ